MHGITPEGCIETFTLQYKQLKFDENMVPTEEIGSLFGFKVIG